MRRWIIIALGLTACSPQSKLAPVPIVNIPKISKSYSAPQWEEPGVKNSSEESAELLREPIYSIADYIQIKWCVP